MTERAPPVSPSPRQIEPYQLGRTAADVEDQGQIRVVVEKGCATRNRQPRLRLARQNLDPQPQLAVDSLDELLAVLGHAAGFRRHQACAGDVVPAHLGSTDSE